MLTVTTVKGNVVSSLSRGYITVSRQDIEPGDPDYLAFIAAAGITDSTQQAAINNFITGMKAAGLWTKRTAIYLFVGGNASAHKFNAKDPRDLDAAFRLTPTGGWTHDGNGVQGNGIDNIINTHLIVDTDINQNNYSYSIYSRTDAILAVQDIGTGNSSHIYTRYIDGNSYNRGIGSPDSYLNPDTLGFFQINSNTTTSTAFKNGVRKLGPQAGSGADPGNSLTIGHVVAGYSPRQFCYADEGVSLTEAESLTLYNLVQAFQTTLGRQV